MKHKYLPAKENIFLTINTLKDGNVDNDDDEFRIGMLFNVHKFISHFLQLVKY